MLSASAGPLLVYGQTAQIGTGNNVLPPDYNPDLAYSGFAIGTGLLDAQAGYQPGGSVTSEQAVIWASGGGYVVVDYAPSAIATANIAALAHVTSGTAMTLVSSTGSGITVMASALTLPWSGVVIPAGSLCIDALPAVLTYGSNGNIVSPDPRTLICRAISISGVSGGAGGTFTVRGADYRGAAMSQTVTVAAGANTVASLKGFKFIYSVTPNFNDAHNYSVGTADVYSFPMRVDEFAFVEITWNNAPITSNTGFTAAVTTTASATTGDVRGTYAVQSASDGTKKLQIQVEIPPWNAGTFAGVYGVAQA